MVYYRSEGWGRAGAPKLKVNGDCNSPVASAKGSDSSPHSGFWKDSTLGGQSGGQIMNRQQLGRGRRPGRTVQSVVSLRGARLRCRDCKEYCQARAAIRESRRRQRCPSCGGILEGETNGQAK